MLAFGAIVELPIAAIPDEDRLAVLGKFAKLIESGTSKRIYLVEITAYQPDDS